MPFSLIGGVSAAAAGRRAAGDSLRRRLPILIFMLLGVLGGTLVWLAYTEVEQALRGSGTQRLPSAATVGARDRLIQQMAPITVGVMVFGAFAVYWVSGRITRSLESLAQAAKAIAAGDYSRRVRLDARDDEIGRLGAAFNTMAERVQADRELLEQRLAERTRDLEAFSASILHDLRAPLREIASSSTRLETDAANQLDEQGRCCLNTIAEAARRMGRMVDDLLGFSRMGEADVIEAGVDLRELVLEVVKDVERDSPDRRIAWTIRDLPVVVGDRGMLRVALTNLIQNAHKYTSVRELAAIEIGTAAKCEGQHVIYVRDNGVGFDPEHAGKLFGLFQRLHGSEGFEGAGIGLATVRRIVQRHGGRTWAEGRMERGATFYITLPGGGGTCGAPRTSSGTRSRGPTC